MCVGGDISVHVQPENTAMHVSHVQNGRYGIMRKVHEMVAGCPSGCSNWSQAILVDSPLGSARYSGLVPDKQSQLSSISGMA